MASDPRLHDGQFVLTDLITLGQVGIEVILAREHRAPCHGGAHRQTELDRHAHDFGIQHRSTPG